MRLVFPLLLILLGAVLIGFLLTNPGERVNVTIGTTLYTDVPLSLIVVLALAVGVGFIALAGVAVEIGVVMLVYLNQAMRRRDIHSVADVREAITEGALLRIRPVIMTVAATIGGLLPIMFGTGTGSEVMRRIAAPMVGGMVSATILTLAVIPALFLLWQSRRL